MTTTNLKTATSAAPRVLVSQYVPITGAAQYQADVGTTTEFASVLIANTDTVARTVTVKLVPAGSTAAATPPLLAAVAVPAKDVIDLGQMFLGDGDFIWAEAVTASTIVIGITGIEFSNATGAAITGIQDDAIGTFGRTAGSSTVTSSLAFGSNTGRRAYAALMATSTTGTVSYSAYDTLTINLGALAMTPKISCDFNNGGVLNGSIHIFEYINPPSASTQTLTATVAKSGITFNLTLASISLSGIASATVTGASGPSSAAALSLAVTSAVGHRALFAGAFDVAPMDFNKRVRAFNGNPAVGFSIPHWMLFADALGAATVTATTSNSQNHCAVGLDLVPA